jgi:hypothetical protein
MEQQLPGPPPTSGEAVPLGEALVKRLLFFLAGVAILILWAGILLQVLAGRRADLIFNLGGFVATTGALVGFLVALAGGLGSRKTSQQQNLGLLVVAAGFLLAAIQLASRIP